MKTTGIVLGTLGALGMAASAQAAISDFIVDGGEMAASDNSCVAPIPVFVGDDCSYNATDPVTGGSSEWVGPLFTHSFYDIGSSPFETGPAEDRTKFPPAGDSRTPTPIDTAADVSRIIVDDQGTTDCADDVISGTIAFGPKVRNVGTGQANRVEERWDSIVHTLTPATVDSGAANAAGGCDYVIGSDGFPELLEGAEDAFPSEIGSIGASAITGPYWDVVPAGGDPANLSGIGISAFEGNTGTSSTAVATNTSCEIDVQGGGDCDSAAVWSGASGTFDWENVLVSASTRASGAMQLFAFVLHEYDILMPLGDRESYDANTVELIAFANGVVYVPVDDEAAATSGASTDIDVLGNDLNITDPVTVSVPANSDQGGALSVNGTNPGASSQITVSYTSPSASFVGTDTFTYTVTNDNGDEDTGTVTVTVTEASAPTAENKTATINFSVSPSALIDLLANNTLGNQPTTATASGATGGTVSVDGSGVATFVASGTSESGSFSYTLTDDDGDTATGTVTITITNLPDSGGGGGGGGPQIVLKSGGSAAGAGFLALLVLATWLRRRPRNGA